MCNPQNHLQRLKVNICSDSYRVSHCVRRTSADITCMGYCVFCTSCVLSIGTLRSIICKTRNKRFVFIRTITSCTDISSSSVFLKNRAYLEIIKRQRSRHFHVRVACYHLQICSGSKIDQKTS